MSLIRVRRNRKKSWIKARKGIPTQKLIIALIGVVIAIWYLSARF